MITLHESQSAVFSDIFIDKVARHFTIVASRGWGKSWFAGTCAVNAGVKLLKPILRVRCLWIHASLPNLSRPDRYWLPAP